jgi:hypothetical protein
LLSVSDAIVFFFGTLTISATLAIAASDPIERRIINNTAAAKQEGKVTARQLRLLNLPRNWLTQGWQLWGLASLLFGLQVAALVANSDFGFPYPDDLFVWAGLIVCLMAGFQTYRILSFVVNPDYSPMKIPIFAIFTALSLGFIDYSASNLFLLPYWQFLGYFGPLSKVFYAFLTVSVAISVAFWLAINNFVRALTKHKNAIALVWVSPYVLLVLYIAWYLLRP